MSKKISSGRTFEKRGLSLRNSSLQKNAQHFPLNSTKKTLDKPPPTLSCARARPEKPSEQKTSDRENGKNAKSIRGISRKTEPEKNAQHFPLNLPKNRRRWGGARMQPRFLREFRGIRRSIATYLLMLDIILHTSGARYRPNTEERERERERERKEPGEKTVRVRASGAPKEAPQRTIRLLGPCDPKQTLATQIKTNRRGSESLRPRRAFDPLPSLGQGERARPPAGRPS